MMTLRGNDTGNHNIIRDKIANQPVSVTDILRYFTVT